MRLAKWLPPVPGEYKTNTFIIQLVLIRSIHDIDQV